MTFTREDRYIVIKRKHLSKEVERQLLIWLNTAEVRQVQRAVVVEGDWPEYETVWRMIEDRCRPSKPLEECTQAEIDSQLAIIREILGEEEFAQQKQAKEDAERGLI